MAIDISIDWTIERCADYCRSGHCDYHWPGPGRFIQGSGYTAEEAQFIAGSPRVARSAVALAKLCAADPTVGRTIVEAARLLLVDLEMAGVRIDGQTER